MKFTIFIAFGALAVLGVNASRRVLISSEVITYDEPKTYYEDDSSPMESVRYIGMIPVTTPNANEKCIERDEFVGKLRKILENEPKDHLKSVLSEHVCTFGGTNDQCLSYVEKNIEEIRTKILKHLGEEALLCNADKESFESADEESFKSADDDSFESADEESVERADDQSFESADVDSFKRADDESFESY